MTARFHLPHLHIGRHASEAFEHAFRHRIHDEPLPELPRLVPAADNWPEWDWASQSGNGYEPEEVTQHGEVS